MSQSAMLPITVTAVLVPSLGPVCGQTHGKIQQWQAIPPSWYMALLLREQDSRSFVSSTVPLWPLPPWLGRRCQESIPLPSPVTLRGPFLLPREKKVASLGLLLPAFTVPRLGYRGASESMLCSKVV